MVIGFFYALQLTSSGKEVCSVYIGTLHFLTLGHWQLFGITNFRNKFFISLLQYLIYNDDICHGMLVKYRCSCGIKKALNFM
jgi:hypothetical protein